jgi:hypothetical protein
VHISDDDRMAPAAFDGTIKRWQESGEQIPVQWCEVPSYSYPVGSVDPATIRKVDGGWLFFKGSLDLEGEDREHRIEADHAWTAIKANGVLLELDYAVLENDEDEGVRTLQEVDLTGLTLKPTGEGSAAIRRKRVETDRELRRESERLQVEVALGCSLDEFRKTLEEDDDADDNADGGTPTEAELRAKSRELGVPAPPPPRRSATYLSIDADPAEIKAEAEALMTTQLRGDR